MIRSLQEKVELNNGVKIPGFGLGTFQISNEETKSAVKEAIRMGYRLIDTAQIYDNENGVGVGIREGLAITNLRREDLFITSKVWNNYLTYDETINAFEESLEKLGLDYLDLYLIHWPGQNAFKESWKALEDLYKKGKIKSIGVSNFEKHHLETLLASAVVKPVLNQVELHPKLTQVELRNICSKNEIAIQAWAPLMQGQILTNPTIEEIAKKHNCSAAQVVLRWHIQQQILVVSKSIKPERIKKNAELFDFSLSDDEMEQISSLNENQRVGPNPEDFDFS